MSQQSVDQGKHWWEELLDLDDKQGPVEEETLLEELSGTQVPAADLMELEILVGQDEEEDMEADVAGEGDAASSSGGCSTTRAEEDAAFPAKEARPASTGLAPRDDDERARETGGASSGYDRAHPTEGTPVESPVGPADDSSAREVGRSSQTSVIEELVWERKHGPVSQLKMRKLRSRSARFLKGILGPPKVDGYIKDIMAVVSGRRSKAELSSRRYSLGHRLAECIGTCHTTTRRAKKWLKDHVNRDLILQVTALLRYARACLCNALHTWRVLLSRSLLAAFLPRSEMWLCDKTSSNHCCTLLGKATARKLRNHVYSSSRGPVADIIREELQARHSCGNFPNGKTKDKTVSSMEKWVREGSDLLAEKEIVEQAGGRIDRVILAASIEGKNAKFLKQFHRGKTSQKLREKEYLVSCDLANAANALIASLKILPPQALELVQTIEASAHFVCISLFHLDTYRREGILSGLKLRGGRLGRYASSFPVGNDGLLFGEDLLFGLKKALEK